MKAMEKTKRRGIGDNNRYLATARERRTESANGQPLQ